MAARGDEFSLLSTWNTMSCFFYFSFRPSVMRRLRMRRSFNLSEFCFQPFINDTFFLPLDQTKSVPVEASSGLFRLSWSLSCSRFVACKPSFAFEKTSSMLMSWWVLPLLSFLSAGFQKRRDLVRLRLWSVSRFFPHIFFFALRSGHFVKDSVSFLVRLNFFFPPNQPVPIFGFFLFFLDCSPVVLGRVSGFAL